MTMAKKTTVPFLADGYEPEANTAYQFHGCHWHGRTYLKNRTKRQQKRYKDTCQIDWLIKKIMDGMQSIFFCQLGNMRNQF